MKIQVSRLSPRQNGKVLAILTAIAVVVVAMPFAAIGYLLFDVQDERAKEVGGFLIFSALLLAPIVYFVVTYISVVVVCGLYNLMFRFIGGVEYEIQRPASTGDPDSKRD